MEGGSLKNYFAENLKYLREKNKMSQEKLAEKLGVELGAISHWENKRREPKMEMVLKIANFFNVNENIIFKDLRKENSNIDEYAVLFNKYKELDEDDKELIKNLIETRKKQIDKELDG